MKAIFVNAGFSAAIILLLMGCSKPKDVVFVDVQNLNLDRADLTESVISADLRYYNPNNFRLKLKDGDLDVTVNDTYMGHYKLDTLLEIPKLDTFSIPVKLKVDMKTLLSKAASIILTNEVDIKLDGNAKLGKSGIYFNVPIHYQGKKRLDMFRLEDLFKEP
jgi:LEA14-like dessication related protein